MRRPRALALAMTAALLLPSCATRASVRALSDRIDQVGGDIAEIRRQQEAAARDSAAAVTELRALTARMRDTEARMRDTADRVASLGNRIAAAEASLREVTTAAAAPPAVTPSAVPLAAESSVTAERAFAAALTTFRSGEHGQAVLELMDFIRRYPTHPLVARAQLWIGEAYYKQRDYRQALVEYRKAVDAASDSTAAASAWLKIGQAYAALRERPAATAAWQRVVRDYPSTEAADEARTLLRR
jgi:tol-pal system protein YbgF